jgi:hypothetical protein
MDAHFSLADALKRRSGGVDEVTYPQLSSVACAAFLIGELVDCMSDGVIQTPIQRPKVTGRDCGIRLHGEVRDSLTDTAVVVHHLPKCRAIEEAFAPLLAGASLDGSILRRFGPQLFDEEFEER